MTNSGPSGGNHKQKHKQSTHHSVSSFPDNEDMAEKLDAFATETTEEPPMGRATIKNISRLIIERDSKARFNSTANVK